MTYAKEPLVVKAQREIPQEVMFSLKNAERDKNIPNRLWFKFPENWAHTTEKERIIGIRDCYVARTQRHILFDLHITLERKVESGEPTPETPEALSTSTTKITHHVIHIDSWMDADKTVKEFIIDINKQCNAQLKDVDGTSFKESHIIMADSFYSDDGQYVVMIHGIPFTDCKITFDELRYSPQNNDLDTLLSQTPFANSDDTVMYIPFKWDRYNLYITSNISDLDSGNFLCHTDRTYTPIKYYRLHSGDDKFWIDTWSTRNHESPSILPEDNKDCLMLEAIVCFDSSAMI